MVAFDDIPKGSARYPEAARIVLRTHKRLLEAMPVPMQVGLFKELSVFDTLFPREQHTIASQLEYWYGLSESARNEMFSGLISIRLSPELLLFDWRQKPVLFLEKMTAELWSTHQIDAFTKAIDVPFTAWRQNNTANPSTISPLCIVILGRGLKGTQVELFKKLRSKGIFFPDIDASDGFEASLRYLATRVSHDEQDYAHWYVDGGDPYQVQSPLVRTISWEGLRSARTSVLKFMRQSSDINEEGPELLRTRLAQLEPEKVGFAGHDRIMDQFQLELLTQGSGTQIFSTTFVQWAARELIRRAQPSTLLLRFEPRRRYDFLSSGFSPIPSSNDLDSAGSLIDADMNAFYTWIHFQTFMGDLRLKFIAWSEEHSQAIAIGPNCPKGTRAAGKISASAMLEL